MNTPSSSNSSQLFDSFPTQIQSQLIVHWPHLTDANLAVFYAESADRLANSYEGKPQDDMILLPFLMLYRQAFELQLKVFTKYLAAVRKKHREPHNPDLDAGTIEAKLRSRQIGHKLEPLQQEMLSHFNALQLAESFPADVSNLIDMLDAADGPGTFFRYAGNLPTRQINIDFVEMFTLFHDQFLMLRAAEDYVSAIVETWPDNYVY